MCHSVCWIRKAYKSFKKGGKTACKFFHRPQPLKALSPNLLQDLIRAFPNIIMGYCDIKPHAKCSLLLTWIKQYFSFVSLKSLKLASGIQCGMSDEMLKC